jgi:hypothetical protein
VTLDTSAPAVNGKRNLGVDVYRCASSGCDVGLPG